MDLVGHIIQHPRFQKLDKITQHHYSTRMEHSIDVAYTSYRIAKKLGWDEKATARGGLLHDFFYYDWRVTKFNKGHAWVHPRIAVRNARKLVDLTKREEDIILKHMWGATIAHHATKKVILLRWLTNIVRLKKRWRLCENDLPNADVTAARFYQAIIVNIE